MSNLFCVEIESNSTMFDSLSIQDSHQKKSQKKILNKKREREKTEVEVEKKKEPSKKFEAEFHFPFEIPEENEFIGEEMINPFKKIEFNAFLDESEISYDDSFIKNQPNNPFKNRDLNAIPYENEINYDDLYLQKNKAKDPFKEIYPEVHLFPKAEINIEDIIQTKFDFSKQTRSKERLPNFKQKHYILVVMKRRFINTYLLNAFNKKLKEAGYNTFFEKLPQSCVINVSKELNNEFFEKTFGQILKEEETYIKEGKTHYTQNLALIDKIEKGGNPELILILNTKICHLFDEYLNSEDFLVTELKRLKESKSKKKKDDYYLGKYVYLAKHWKQFYEMKKNKKLIMLD